MRKSVSFAPSSETVGGWCCLPEAKGIWKLCARAESALHLRLSRLSVWSGCNHLSSRVSPPVYTLYYREPPGEFPARFCLIRLMILHKPLFFFFFFSSSSKSPNSSHPKLIPSRGWSSSRVNLRTIFFDTSPKRLRPVVIIRNCIRHTCFAHKLYSAPTTTW